MDRAVRRHIGATGCSLLLASAVVTAGALGSLPALLYPALVLAGALVTAGAAARLDFGWTVVFGLWPPWALALFLDPTVEFALGLLAGAVGGLLAAPLVLRFGGAVGTAAE